MIPATLRHQLWIIAAAGLVFFTNLGAAALWDEDEPLYATCAREMLLRGDWVVPTYNGEMFPEKPPLMFWLMIAAFQAFGISEFAARLPSAVCGMLVAAVTYWLGRRLFSPRAGLWAGLVMATSLLFTVSARAATVDAALVLLTTVAFWIFLCALDTSEANCASGDPLAWTRPGTDTPGCAGSHARPHLSWWRMALLYACLGLAVLAKGPVGVMLPVAVLGLFLAWLQQVQAAAQKSATFSQGVELRGGNEFVDSGCVQESATFSPAADLPPIPHQGPLARAAGWLRVFGPLNLLRAAWRLRPLTALLVVGLVALPWYVLVSLRTDGQWLARFLGEQNLQRVFKPMQGHQGPIWYYVPAVLIGLFPWSLLVWPALGMTLRKLRRRDGEWAGWLLLACWAGVYFVFWSLVRTKLPHYVLPAFPALALMIGRLIDRWLAEPQAFRRWWLDGTTAALVLVGAGILVGIPIAARRVLPGEGLLGMVGLVPLAGAGVWMWLLNRGRLAHLMPALAATGAATLVAVFGFAALRVDRHQNARYFFAAIEQESAGPAQLAAYKFLRESTVYYAGRQVAYFDDLEQLREFLAHHAETVYLFTSGEFAERIERAFPEQFRLVLRRPRFLKDGEVLLLARDGVDTRSMAGRIWQPEGGAAHAALPRRSEPGEPATASRPKRGAAF